MKFLNQADPPSGQDGAVDRVDRCQDRLGLGEAGLHGEEQDQAEGGHEQDSRNHHGRWRKWVTKPLTSNSLVLVMLFCSSLLIFCSRLGRLEGKIAWLLARFENHKNALCRITLMTGASQSRFLLKFTHLVLGRPEWSFRPKYISLIKERTPMFIQKQNVLHVQSGMNKLSSPQNPHSDFSILNNQVYSSS